ncbi:hypothetical protein CFAM422_001293 [Trichoderma lentiforme]|uniref:Uncharacterized protein n=1 Tax=Trichoderma lentiforme TaxID=1567552 RepID=A0A9P4XQN8_9HYPO|nr:hypothetical protein CFAM422_001293 [Trichoderma lentiforme]
MLSAQAHLVFWALSFISLLAQPLRPSLKEHFDTNGEVQGVLECAIFCYFVWLCLFIIELRTRPSPYHMPRKSKGKRQPQAKVGSATLWKRDWFFEVGTGLMCLIVGDAALWASGVKEEEGIRGKIVRVLGTYFYLGTVDPIWRYQLRHDMMLFSQAVPELMIRNVLVSTASIGAVSFTVEAAAFVYTGEPLDVLKFWFEGTTRMHQVLVLMLLLAPFADLADTLVYLYLKRYNYKQYLVQIAELTRLRSRSMILERLWVMLWLWWMFSVLRVYDYM